MRHLLLALALPLIVIAAPPPSPDDQQAILNQIEDRLTGEQQTDWRTIRQAHGHLLSQADSQSAFYHQLNLLLDKLNLSHFHIAPPAYDTETPAAAEQAGQLGLVVLMMDDEPRISQVEPESPAATAGIQPGWRLLAIDGRPVAPYLDRLRAYPGDVYQQRKAFARAMEAALRSEPGLTRQLTLRDHEDQLRELELTAQAPEGQPLTFGNLPPMHGRVEQRRLPGNLGYLHFNIFLLPLLGEIQQAVRDLHDSHGMILDLRGNPGGIGLMACPVAALFVSEPTSLGRSNLNGGFINFAVFPSPHPYTKPLVILVDERTGSTAEILAGGLQELGRATIIGRQTMGEVLPSIVVSLPDGSRLQFAVADFQTPQGTQLEGTGVVPDQIVKPHAADWTTASDPFLRAAIHHLTTPETSP